MRVKPMSASLTEKISIFDPAEQQGLGEAQAIQVELVEGKTSEEQRAAYARFMEWYRVKIVLQKTPNRVES
jgi:hypothetical protein